MQMPMRHTNPATTAGHYTRPWPGDPDLDTIVRPAITAGGTLVNRLQTAHDAWRTLAGL